MAQKKPSRAIKLFGTEVPDGKRRELRAGPISAVFDSGALRYIRYHGEEALRGIAYIVRDKNWGTYAPAIENLKVRQSKNGFAIGYEATCKDKDQAIRYSAKIDARSDGTLKFSAEGTPLSDFLGRSCWIEASGGLRDWLELDVKAELFKTSNEPAGLEFDGAPIKVGAAEVVVLDAVFEDVVDGGEDRCGNGADGFLRSTLALQPEELGSVVAVFLALGGPGALHQHGLEPGGSLAQARRFALAGAFVLPRTQPGPGDEVPGGWKAAHVAADLGHDGGGRHGADARDCAQKLNQGAKRDLAALTLRTQAADPLIDFAVDLSDRLIQTIPLL